MDDFSMTGTKRPWRLEGNLILGADDKLICEVTFYTKNDPELVIEAVNSHDRLSVECDYIKKKYKNLRNEFEELVRLYAKAREENDSLRKTLSELTGNEFGGEMTITHFDHG